MKKIKYLVLAVVAAASLSLSSCVVRERGAGWVPGHYDVGPYGGRHWVPGHYR